MTEECKECEYMMEDETCCAFECNGVDCPTLPCEDYWIFTFGYGEKHSGKYVKIRGTHDQARKKMFEKYGESWAFQYSMEKWEEMANDPHRDWVMETELEVIE